MTNFKDGKKFETRGRKPLVCSRCQGTVFCGAGKYKSQEGTFQQYMCQRCGRREIGEKLAEPYRPKVKA